MIATQMSEPLREDVLLLPDLRRLAYAEYGDPAGTPLFFFHGFPGSRYEAALGAGEATAHGIRIIAPDRPARASPTTSHAAASSTGRATSSASLIRSASSTSA